MFTPLILSSGKRHPYLLYGTAFKKEKTGALTTLALQHGFEGIDTANYPSGYEEALTGDGITKSGVNRNDILVSQQITLLAR
jgi:diketogulonate reductase-like aldo/keto reductase